MSQTSLLPEVAPVSPFQFQNHPIRTQVEGDTLWFVAKDVCEALGIVWKSGKGAGNSGTLAAIPAEWQGMIKLTTPSGRQQLKVIVEPAVYKLAFRSNKPEADAFTNWIASEVVPSIRKTGKYEATVLTSEPSSLTPSSVADRKPLRSLVNAWARVSGQPFDACWSQLKAAFRLTDIRDLPQEWIPDAIAWVQAKIDALPKALPSAPAPERLPMYRNGAFYPPHINKAHIPGPSEAALMALWKDWPRREKVISDAFNALMDDIRKYQGDSFPHLVSDMGRNADTMFGVDCLLEGLYCAQTSAISNFKRALELARLHLRLAVNVAVVQGR